MIPLRSKIIRLAHSQPTLRPYLLPLLKTAKYLMDPRLVQDDLPAGDLRATLRAVDKREQRLFNALEKAGWKLTKRETEGEITDRDYTIYLTYKSSQDGELLVAFSNAADMALKEYKWGSAAKRTR